MVQDILKYRFLIKSVAAVALLLSLSGFGYVYAADETDEYLYLQETATENAHSSCAKVFAAIRTGNEEDVGGVVRSLKTINVTYLLDDYDNVLTSDRRKQNYLTYEELLAEVAANKRESYCRIELALYMKKNAAFAGPVYGDLLNEAFEKLDETYATALRSFKNEQFARSAYAFDLIAPYHDAHQMQLAAAKRLAEKTGSKVAVAVAPAAEPVASIAKDVLSPGPIVLAVHAGQSEFADKSAAMKLGQPGSIMMATQPGPITAALSATE